MAVSTGIFIAFLVVASACLTNFARGAPTIIIVRAISDQQKTLAYDKTSDQCTTIDNMGDFIVHELNRADNEFCIVMYKNAQDCLNRPIKYDYLIKFANLTEARNLPPVQAFKHCSPSQLAG